MDNKLETSTTAKILTSLPSTVSVLAPGSTNYGYIYKPKVKGPTFNINVILPKEEAPLAFTTFISVIKAFYIKHERLRCELIKRIGEFKIDQIFVNVAVVRESEQLKKEKSTLSDKRENLAELYTNLSSYEEIYGTKISIALEDLFEGKSEIDCVSDVRRLLIVGRAGIGKSTLLHYMAYCWAQGNLWQNKHFKVPIWLILKELTANYYQSANASIASAVHKRFGFSQLGISIAAVQKVLIEYADQILYLADGFDEVAAIAQEKEGATTDQGDMIRDVLSLGNLLLSSRPYYIDAFCASNRCGFDRKIEAIGFLDKDIDLYIEKFFKPAEQNLAKKLQPLLKYNQAIRGIAHIPLMLGLICKIWLENAGDAEKMSQLTMTVLYQMLINDIAEKAELEFSAAAFDSQSVFLEELGKYPGLCALAELASLQMQERDLIIPHTKLALILRKYAKGISEKNLLKQILSLGLLKAVDEGEIHEERKDYYFVHLTFQEFLAAIYWVQLYTSTQAEQKQEANKTLSQRKLFSSYEIVWWFVAGLLTDNTQALEKYFDLLTNESIDIIGFTEDMLIVRCLEECSLKLSKPKCEALLKKISAWLEWASYCNNLSSLAHYLNLSPNVFAHEIVCQQYLALLRDNGGELKSGELRYNAFQALEYHLALPEPILRYFVELLPQKDSSGVIDYAFSRQTALPEHILRQLVDLLKDQTYGYKAASILSYQCTMPDSILQSLVNLLENRDKDRSSKAADSFGGQIILPEFILNALIALFQLNDEKLRLNVSKILEKQRSLPESILIMLLDIMQHRQELVLPVTIILQKQIKLPEPILKILANCFQKSKEIKHGAILALYKQDALPEFILELLVSSLLIDKDKNALHPLLHQRTLPETILRKLIDLLHKEEKTIRFPAARAVEKQAKQASLSDPISELLLTMIQREETKEYTKCEAAAILLHQRSLPEHVLIALANLIPDQQSITLRDKITHILCNQASLPQGVTKLLGNLLCPNQKKDILLPILKALSEQTSLEDNILKALVELLCNDDDEIALIAARILEKQLFLPDHTLNELFALLKEAEEGKRITIMISINKRYKLPDPIIDFLIQLLEKANEDQLAALPIICQQAILSLPFLNRLQVVLQKFDKDYLFAPLANVLSNQMALPDNVIEKLFNLFNSDFEYIRKEVIEALSHQILKEAFLKRLVEKSQSKEPWQVREVAVSVLSCCTNIPASILEELSTVLRVSDWPVDILGKQTRLPLTVLKNIGLSNFQLNAKIEAKVYASVRSLSLLYLLELICQNNDQDDCLYSLLFLKCLKEKVALSFDQTNKLFVNGIQFPISMNMETISKLNQMASKIKLTEKQKCTLTPGLGTIDFLARPGSVVTGENQGQIQSKPFSSL